MNLTLLGMLSVAFATGLPAQTRAYAGTSLGWMSVIDPNAPEKAVTIDGHRYSVTQMQTARTLMGWIQQSYTPTGAIGQTFKFANEKLSMYNDHTTAQPHRYGALARTYIDLKKGADGPGEAGLSPTEREVAGLHGFPSAPSLRKYISWYQPKGIATTLQFVVLLCRDSRKPYVAVTKGEYLEALGRAIERDAAARQSSGGNAASIATQLERRRAALARLKTKYQNRLAEPAKTSLQPGLSIEDETTFDVFENRTYPAEYAVYKFDPAAVAAARTDTPQWIVISWEAEGVANGEEAGTHLHRSMLERVNYDYISDYFFAPEKVRGEAYRPLR